MMCRRKLFMLCNWRAYACMLPYVCTVLIVASF
jgi:hypothetical protein